MDSDPNTMQNSSSRLTEYRSEADLRRFIAILPQDQAWGGRYLFGAVKLKQQYQVADIQILQMSTTPKDSAQNPLKLRS